MNTAKSLIGKAVLQNRMALAIITALQAVTHVVIETDRCVFILEESAHVSSFY